MLNKVDILDDLRCVLNDMLIAEDSVEFNEPCPWDFRDIDNWRSMSDIVSKAIEYIKENC